VFKERRQIDIRNISGFDLKEINQLLANFDPVQTT
jgi:hypothetical protein